MSHTQILTASGRSQFTLRAGTRKWNIANCFRIRNIPLPSASNWHAKWINFFHPGITQILTAAGRSQFTLCASLRHLEVEYCETENMFQNPEPQTVTQSESTFSGRALWGSMCRRKGRGLLGLYWLVPPRIHKNTFKLGWMLLLFDRKIALNNSYLIGTLNNI